MSHQDFQVHTSVVNGVGGPSLSLFVLLELPSYVQAGMSHMHTHTHTHTHTLPLCKAISHKCITMVAGSQAQPEL